MLGGQSYGGLLAQAYLAHKIKAVERLILSSTGPADYGKAWLPAEYVFIALARLLPEKTVKNLLTGGLLKAITLPEAERAEWLEAIDCLIGFEIYGVQKNYSKERAPMITQETYGHQTPGYTQRLSESGLIRRASWPRGL